MPRGCLSLLKKRWHLHLTHTQKCVRALANLGTRVNPGNPRRVEGRGDWPILTQPRQDFDWHSKLLHNFLTGVGTDGAYHCVAQEGCLAYTHILQPSLFLQKSSRGTAEHMGCQFKKEKKFVLPVYAYFSGLFSRSLSLKHSRGTLGTESSSRSLFGTVFSTPRELNSTDTNTFMGL